MVSGTMIHLAYKNPTGGGVPSPVDGPTITEWPLDFWIKMVPFWAASGVTVVLLPPVCKGATLGGGWDPKDHYDRGSKFQSGRRETRYGSIEALRRFIAVCRAFGLQVYLNVVLHHVDGSPYSYPGADGTPGEGRFPLDANCLVPGNEPNPDGVPDPTYDSGPWAFGDRLRWNSGTYGDGKGMNGPGYVRNGLRDSLDNTTQTLNIDGFYHDDGKGVNAWFTEWIYNQKSMAGKFVFAEYYDSNVNTLEWYRAQVGGRLALQDFALRGLIYNICNNPGRADIRALLGETLTTRDPFNAVGFVEDADTDESDPVVTNQLFGFAIICTVPCYPMLFGKSLYRFIDCYGLMDQVMTLTFVHYHCAVGPQVVRKDDFNYLLFERISNPGLLVGLNNRPGDINNPSDWTFVSDVPVQYWPGTVLHDHSGHANDITVSQQMTVDMWLPPNDGGRGYVLYTFPNLGGPVKLTPRRTQQFLYGESDLDLGPAAPLTTTQVTEIWADESDILFTTYEGDGLTFSVERPTPGTPGYTKVMVTNKNAAETPFIVCMDYMGADVTGIA